MASQTKVPEEVGKTKSLITRVIKVCSLLLQSAEQLITQHVDTLITGSECSACYGERANISQLEVEEYT